MLLELGKVPLSLFFVKASIKNCERIRSGKGTPLLISSYQNALKKNLKWIQGIKRYLKTNGMMNSFINPGGNVTKQYLSKTR